MKPNRCWLMILGGLLSFRLDGQECVVPTLSGSTPPAKINFMVDQEGWFATAESAIDMWKNSCSQKPYLAASSSPLDEDFTNVSVLFRNQPPPAPYANKCAAVHEGAIYVDDRTASNCGPKQDWKMIRVLAHEMGHYFGLLHSSDGQHDSTCWPSIMHEAIVNSITEGHGRRL